METGKPVPDRQRRPHVRLTFYPARSFSFVLIRSHSTRQKEFERRVDPNDKNAQNLLDEMRQHVKKLEVRPPCRLGPVISPRPVVVSPRPVFVFAHVLRRG